MRSPIRLLDLFATRGRNRAHQPLSGKKESTMLTLNRLAGLMLALFLIPLLTACQVTMVHELGDDELELAEAFVGALYTEDGLSLTDILARCGDDCPDFDGLEPVENDDGSVSLCDGYGYCFVRCEYKSWKPNKCDCDNDEHENEKQKSKKKDKGKKADDDDDDNAGGWIVYNPPVYAQAGDTSSESSHDGDTSSWASGTGGAAEISGDITAEGGSAEISGDVSATGGNAWQHQQQTAEGGDAEAQNWNYVGPITNENVNEAVAWANANASNEVHLEVNVHNKIYVRQPVIIVNEHKNEIEIEVKLPLGMTEDECDWCAVLRQYLADCGRNADCIPEVITWLMERCENQDPDPGPNPTDPPSDPTDPPAPTDPPSDPTDPPSPTDPPAPTPEDPTPVPDPTDPPLPIATALPCRDYPQEEPFDWFTVSGPDGPGSASNPHFVKGDVELSIPGNSWVLIDVEQFEWGIVDNDGNRISHEWTGTLLIIRRDKLASVKGDNGANIGCLGIRPNGIIGLRDEMFKSGCHEKKGCKAVRLYLIEDDDVLQHVTDYIRP